MPAEERINSIILLKHTLEKIGPILEALKGCRSGLLLSIQNVLFALENNISCARIRGYLRQSISSRKWSTKTRLGQRVHWACVIKDAMQSRYAFHCWSWCTERCEWSSWCRTSKFQRSHIWCLHINRCLQKYILFLAQLMQVNSIYQLIWSLRNDEDITWLLKRAILKKDACRVNLRMLLARKEGIYNMILWICVKRMPNYNTRWMRSMS